MSSARTLSIRSTWNQRSNRGPILATVHSYRILQFAVVVFSPFIRSSSSQGDAGIQVIIPSLMTTSMTSSLLYHIIRYELR
jgi:hypothetical protein